MYLKFPRTGHELLTCHYSLQLDSYNGCIHKCVYCYAENFLKRKVRKINIKKFEREFEKYLEGKETSIGEAIKRKIVIRLGGRTDCFQKIEEKFKITRKIIEFLNSYEYPYMIVTKSPLVAKYTNIIENKLAIIQFSITSLKEKIAKKIEPYAPPPFKRIEAMKDLYESGYLTIARFSPIIPNINLREAENIMEALSTNHIIVEFLRASKYVVKKFNLKNYVKMGYYYRYNFKKKLEVYKKLREVAHNFGLKFSICPDGDKVPYYLNDTLNCCGIDMNCVNKVASMVYMEAKRKGKVTLKDMEKYWHPMKTKFIKAWLKGEFERLIHKIKWNKEEKCYLLE